VHADEGSAKIFGSGSSFAGPLCVYSSFILAHGNVPREVSVVFQLRRPTFCEQKKRTN
jgi:hypothetical protein